MDTITVKCIARPEEIAFIASAIHSFDGLATLRTVDSTKGEIEFWVSPQQIDDFRLVFEDLNKFTEISILTWGEFPSEMYSKINYLDNNDFK